MAKKTESSEQQQNRLVISFYSPSQGHAGGLRLLELYTEIKKLRSNLHLTLVTFKRENIDWKDEICYEIFDDVIKLTSSDFGKKCLDHLTVTNSDIEFIDLQYHQCGMLIDSCKRLWPNAKIAFSPMESLAESLFNLDLEIIASPKRLIGSILNAFLEQFYIYKADRVIFVSKSDADAIATKIGCLNKKTNCVYTGVSNIEFVEPTAELQMADRDIIAFVAYYGSETNRQALKWFCKNVHGKIKVCIPDYKFKVIGRGLDIGLINECESDGVEIVGEVESIRNSLKGVKIGIAPALSGSGFRGKIHQYAAMGLACVASPIANQGMLYKDGESIMLGANPDEFASACIRLLEDEQLRHKLVTKAYKKCSESYTWRAIIPQIKKAYDL